MAEDRHALLKLYRQTREELLSVLEGLTDAQLSEETLDGWSTDITGVTERGALPAKAVAYLDRIAKTVGAPVGMIGVGPERAATLL